MKSKEKVTEVVNDIWSQVLEAGDPLPDDIDFNQIGGSSLKSLIVLSELNQAFEMEFEVAENIKHTTHAI